MENYELNYIESNHFKPTFNENGNKEKKGLELVVNKYLFKRYRVNKSSINWICKNEKCKSSITIDKNEKVIYFNDHIGEMHEITAEKLMRIEFLNKLKIRAITEDSSINKKLALGCNISYSIKVLLSASYLLCVV